MQSNSSKLQFENIHHGGGVPLGFPSIPENWISQWASFQSADGKVNLYSIFHQKQFVGDQKSQHQKNQQKKRFLILFHGLGEHCGRYLHFPHFLNVDVAGIYCLDLRGHGRSGGLRGHVERFDAFAEDAALGIMKFQEYLESQSIDYELHLFAHSMGGLVALRTLTLFQSLPLASVTLSAPLLKIRAKVPWIKKQAAVFLKMIWSSLQLETELDASKLSHDPEVANSYEADRLVHRKMTASFYFQMLGAMAEVTKTAPGIHYPIQFLIPMQDFLVDPESSIRYFEGLKNPDKSLKTYPEFYHESFNEIGKEGPFEDLRQWIITHPWAHPGSPPGSHSGVPSVDEAKDTQVLEVGHTR